jgi:nicotinate-nucleotide--dimethylbenzimidazole phosphoribosyltransferase
MTSGETALHEAIDGVQARGPLDAHAMAEAGAILDGLTKPPGSLGRLEWLAAWLAGVTGVPRTLARDRAIVVAAADHGVTRQGVSAYPSDVTAQMVANFVVGGAAINVLAGRVGASVTVIDVGVASRTPARGGSGEAGGHLVERRVRDGTADMSVEPAMSRDEAIAAIEVGLQVVDELRHAGVGLIGVGEMGIGNTTAASAVTAALTGAPIARVTGRGTGLDEAAVEHKVRVIEAALALHRPDPADPVGVLAAVGGLDIAALTGVLLGAVGGGIPVVLDGFITGAAALLAVGLAPEAAPRMLASHRSVEPGHTVILERLGLAPLLDLELRLGEGTGAALAIGLIDAAIAIRDGMATFASAGIAGPTGR